MAAVIRSVQPVQQIAPCLKPLSGKPAKTALHQAVRDGRVHQTKLLLAKLADVDVQDVNGWTPLMLACTLENEEQAMKMVKVFLERGSFINMQDKMGRTPLMIATLSDKLQIMRQLLAEENVELLIEDTDGNTALHHAATSQATDMLTLCSDHWEKRPDGLRLIMNQMVRFGLTCDTRNVLGYTALLLACKHGNHESALELVRKAHGCPYLRDNEYKYSAKDWILKRRSDQQTDWEEKARFPHLLDMRIMKSRRALPAERSITTLLERTYKPMMLENAGRARTEILTLPTADSGETLETLLQEMTRIEEVHNAARARMAAYRNGSEVRPKRRDVKTATLRSVAPQFDECRLLELSHIFKLYAIECREGRSRSSVKLPEVPRSPARSTT